MFLPFFSPPFVGVVGVVGVVAVVAVVDVSKSS